MTERQTTMKLWLIFGVLCGISVNATVSAQESFYKGKVVRIVTGASAGGGLDTYARTIARHMRKHIPGNPAMIVENMPGAGGLIMVNHLAKVAKPDGLTIGTFIGDLVGLQLMGRPGLEADFSRIGYIGVPLRDTAACALTKASGITTVEKWMASKTPVKLGSTGPMTGIDNTPRILKGLLGLPIQVVAGYKGTAEIRLAAESGELAGACWVWGSIKPGWRKAIQSGDVVVVLQNRTEPHPDLANVPLASAFAKTRESRELLQISDLSPISFTYAVAAGSPADRLQTLRRAFMDTMKDPEFLADAEKSQVLIDPMGGEEVEKIVDKFLNLEPAMAMKLRDILSAK
jgi:tripartite-type tricarboxylate transporter receptor subunit TctC